MVFWFKSYVLVKFFFNRSPMVKVKVTGLKLLASTKRSFHKEYTFVIWKPYPISFKVMGNIWPWGVQGATVSMSILCFILHRTVDHHFVKTIGQFVYLTVQVNLKCKWDSRDIESIKCGTIGINVEFCNAVNLTFDLLLKIFPQSLWPSHSHLSFFLNSTVIN